MQADKHGRNPSAQISTKLTEETFSTVEGKQDIEYIMIKSNC